MPKLPHLFGAEIVRALEGCVVPMHREVKVGTLAGVLRQAGIAPEDSIEAVE